MQRFSANYIFPTKGKAIRNGVVVLDNNQTIVDIIDPKGNEIEYESMEFHNGVIVPGFINAHCHTELSHLKGKVDNDNHGIAGFISQIRSLRDSADAEIQAAIKQAIYSLEISGTVAVGDICNSTDSFLKKQSSNLFFHNFIELFGLLENDAEIRFRNAKLILDDAFITNKSNSLTPHAAYSISNKLWGLINEKLTQSNSLVSIHYAESIQEYDFLMNRTGILAENFKSLGIADGIEANITPLEMVKKYIPPKNPTLFVHNTYVKKEEIKDIISYYDSPFFVLCPSSNLFIEGRLPDVQMLIDEDATIALGTDSYASSSTLSIFDQVLILLEKFPSLTFEEVIKWSTYNGAKALGIDSKYGSLEIGKTPGLNLITDFDFNLMKPTPKSRVRRLA